MALEATPASVATDGNLRIAFVATADDPTSVADIIAGHDITYSLTTGGFNHTINENTVDDPRLTLPQTFNNPGTSTETLVLQYVFSTDVGSAYVLLPKNTTGYLVVRRGVANATDWAVGQKVNILTVLTGAQRDDAPTANAQFTVSQNVYIKAVTRRDVTLVA